MNNAESTPTESPNARERVISVKSKYADKPTKRPAPSCRTSDAAGVAWISGRAILYHHGDRAFRLSTVQNCLGIPKTSFWRKNIQFLNSPVGQISKPKSNLDAPNTSITVGKVSQIAKIHRRPVHVERRALRAIAIRGEGFTFWCIAR